MNDIEPRFGNFVTLWLSLIIRPQPDTPSAPRQTVLVKRQIVSDRRPTLWIMSYRLIDRTVVFFNNDAGSQKVLDSSWDIDVGTGHMAHPSGLHAYFAHNLKEDSEYVQCIGPFSSHRHRLKAKDARNYIADVIGDIESMQEFRGKITYWGSLSRKLPSLPTVSIMDHEFGLIPNPCLRSDILIAAQRTDNDPSLLSREWTYFNGNKIEHKLGSRFSFPVSERNRLSIGGRVESIPDDILRLDPALRTVTLKTLGSLAVVVLSKLDSGFAHVGLKKLKLKYPTCKPS